MRAMLKSSIFINLGGITLSFTLVVPHMCGLSQHCRSQSSHWGTDEHNLHREGICYPCTACTSSHQSRRCNWFRKPGQEDAYPRYLITLTSTLGNGGKRCSCCAENSCTHTHGVTTVHTKWSTKSPPLEATFGNNCDVNV